MVLFRAMLLDIYTCIIVNVSDLFFYYYEIFLYICGNTLLEVYFGINMVITTLMLTVYMTCLLPPSVLAPYMFLLFPVHRLCTVYSWVLCFTLSSLTICILIMST